MAKTVNDRLSVVETLRFQTVKKRFACVSVDMKNAVTTVSTYRNLTEQLTYTISHHSFYAINQLLRRKTAVHTCNKNLTFQKCNPPEFYRVQVRQVIKKIQYDVMLYFLCVLVLLTAAKTDTNPVSILRKSISGRHRPVRVADGPMTARCRFT